MNSLPKILFSTGGRIFQHYQRWFDGSGGPVGLSSNIVGGEEGSVKKRRPLTKEESEGLVGAEQEKTLCEKCPFSISIWRPLLSLFVFMCNMLSCIFQTAQNYEWK